MAEEAARLAVSAYGAARITGAHAHEEGQLLSLRAGLQLIETDAGRWVLPPGWIGWIAPRCAHAAQSFGATEGWSLYLDPALTPMLPPGPHVFAPTPLVRELIARLVSLDGDDSPSAVDLARRLRLVTVLIDELAAGSQASLHLAMPRDRRLFAMAAALADDPAVPDTIEQWAARIGMARRTLTRRFAAETGLSFAQWRQQARLLKAVEGLSVGEPVTTVALTVGYSSVSAFIETFRRHFGCTPARFFAQGRELPSTRAGWVPRAKKKPA